MVFSSALFLLLFLPIVLATYWLSPAKFKNPLLLVSSLLFYIWGAPTFAPILIASIGIDYFLIKKLSGSTNERLRYVLLLISILSSVGLLVYFKYYNFAAENLGWKIRDIILPIGISFFTFQKISYAVDVFRNELQPFQKPVDYSLYILFFPQLIAGPIIRYGQIKAQIEDLRRRVTMDEITAGFFRFVLGLSKKLLIADQLGEVCDKIFASSPDTLDMGLAWLGSVTYAFQIYFDFSGYTDMALGLGLMMGFRLPENFNYPYISQSFTEFWRRWHMTLSGWMRDYLYLPLGGNRVTAFRLYFNLWVVFIISGIWHGAEWKFVVWGIYNGLFLVLERVFRIKMGVPLTFFFILVGWVVFRAPSLDYAVEYIGRMFHFASAENFFTFPGFVYFRHEVLLIVCFLLSFMPMFRLLRQQIDSYLYKQEIPGKTQLLKTVVAAFLFFICISQVMNSELDTFIYFRF